MRIGFFTSIEQWGGSENYLLNLMTGLGARGHAVVLFGVDGARLTEACAKKGIPCVTWSSLAHESDTGRTAGRMRQLCVLNATVESSGMQERLSGTPQRAGTRMVLRWTPRGIKLLAGNLREKRRLTRILRANPVDVLHVNVHGYEMAGLAARQAGIPTVGMHCIWPEPMDAVRALLARVSARRYTILASKSSACLRAWVDFLRSAPRQPSAYVYNGVDTKRFAPRAGADDGVFRIVSVGRLHRMKGFDTLLHACACLRPDSFELRIVGDGEELAALKRISVELGVSGNVVFTGHVEWPESVYQSADCFALLSRSHESFPSVLIEAMACALPLVTSDFGPFPEINHDRVTGYVVSVGDADACAERLTRLQGCSQERRVMGIRGRERVESSFSLSRMIEESEALYLRALETYNRT